MIEFLEYALFALLGLAVGFNLRNDRALKSEQRTFEMVDEEVRSRLEIAENLNDSLKSDVRFLKGKIDRLKQELMVVASINK